MKLHTQRKTHTRRTDDVTASDSRITAAARPVVASPSQPAPYQRELQREGEVCRRTGRHRSSLWRDVRSGSMPSPVRIGRRSIAWYADEIDEWISSRPRVRRADEAE